MFNRRTLFALMLTGCLMGAAAAGCGSTQADTRVKGPQGEAESPKAQAGGDDAPSERSDKDDGWSTAVDPKPLSKAVISGLDWLVSQQLASGGWDQGDQQTRGGEQPKGSPNVADTCMATLALVRSGSSPSEGAYRGSVHKGVKFVLGQIEASDKDTLYVTDIRGTRVQSKIGTYVDTFTSLMLLTEVKGKMPDKQANARVERAIDTIVGKIEKNQRNDGTWDNRGWAPVLTQSLAGKGLNRAAQQGAEVKTDTLKKVEDYSKAQFDSSAGGFKASGSAGVDLYAGAASSSGLRDSVNTYKNKAKTLKATVKDTKASPAAREQAKRELQNADAAERAADSTEKALLGRLKDPNYIAGFGSNGGEEFLSYMLVSESLVVKGGDQWKEWDGTITKLLGKAQNNDGSWVGHHCITGRTFCTASALLVLMADRAPVPTAAKMRGG